MVKWLWYFTIHIISGVYVLSQRIWNINFLMLSIKYVFKLNFEILRLISALSLRISYQVWLLKNIHSSQKFSEWKINLLQASDFGTNFRWLLQLLVFRDKFIQTQHFWKNFFLWDICQQRYVNRDSSTLFQSFHFVSIMPSKILLKTLGFILKQ